MLSHSVRGAILYIAKALMSNKETFRTNYISNSLATAYAYLLLPVRLSVCMSVCLSVGDWLAAGCRYVSNTATFDGHCPRSSGKRFPWIKLVKWEGKFNSRIAE